MNASGLCGTGFFNEAIKPDTTLNHGCDFSIDNGNHLITNSRQSQSNNTNAVEV